MVKELTTITDLATDPKRANAGTDRGRDLLKESFDQCGAGRSIAVKNGVVINGNRALEVAQAKGLPITVVRTEGQELVVVKRTDLDLVEQPRARQLAYYDNRVQELGLAWSPRVIQDDLLTGVDVSSSFFPEELDRIASLMPAYETGAAGALPALEAAGPQTPLPVVDDLPDPVKPPRAKKDPAEARLVYEVFFDNYVQQLRWTAFQRLLRERYPAGTPPSVRLELYLAELGIASAGLPQEVP